MMTMEAPLWEQSKENAAPLERGRNVTILERSIATMEDAEKDRTVRHYEGLVRPTEETPPTIEGDPLIHWLSYIKYHQENFPSDTHNEFLLLERCFRALCTVKTYADDQRFIRVCCMYAEKSQRAPDIFKYMHGQKIGHGVAVFWAAWAYVAEKQKDFAFAEKVFEKAIRKKAQPLKYLLQRQQQFQRRMIRHGVNSTHQEDGSSDEEGNVQSRGVLGGLSETAVRRNDRSRASQSSSRLGSRRGQQSSSRTFTIRSDAQTSCPQANENASNGFAIFSDDSPDDNGYPLDSSFVSHQDRVLEREQDRRKENTLNTERWNERGALSNTSIYGVKKPVPRPTVPTAFAVYVDEECAAKNELEEKTQHRQVEQHRRVRDERTFREREHGGAAEKLTSDPLRYVRNPEQMELDQSRRTASSAPVSKQKKAISRITCERFLKSVSGREQSVEEARFKAKYFTLGVAETTNMNLFRKVNGNDDSSMSIDTSMVSVENSQGSMSVSSFLACKARETRTPRNSSTASSTVDEQQAVGLPAGKDEQTINTQLALKELSMMFSSPAFPLTDERRHQESSGGLRPIMDQSGTSESAHLDVISELASHCDPSSSFAAVDAENDGPRNPLARTVANPATALQTLAESPIPRGLGCSSSRRALGMISQDDPMRGHPETELQEGAGFQIYSDSDAEEVVPDEEDDRTPPPASFAIYTDAPSEPQNVGGFEVFKVASNDQDSPTAESEGDTATLSLIGDVFDELAAESSSIPSASNPVLEKGCARAKGIGKGTMGGILRIAIEEDEVQTAKNMGTNNSIEYKDAYSGNLNAAIQRVKASGSSSFPSRETSLVKVLTRGRLVCELQTHTLPRPLKSRHLDLSGATIKVGHCEGTVKRELGRGVYGVVALLDRGDSQEIAIKAQSPAGCLAHEYEILRSIEDRVGEDDKKQSFPRALSFLYFADGALLGMTAASASGLNLIDLVNIYTKHGERIPEILALHYTARMLVHIEALHWKAKILHCDVKPDNWALSESNLICGESIEGSEIMLIDYGRAVDLTAVGNSGDSMATTFKGKACPDEMMCVAMRKGLSWSFDVDTFGICASAHVLLFGSHLDISLTTSNRWMPSEEIRGYFQVDLWTDLFDKLLNIDDVTKSAIGSRPHSLRQLRSRFENYLTKRQDRVLAALKHQAVLLHDAK